MKSLIHFFGIAFLGLLMLSCSGEPQAKSFDLSSTTDPTAADGISEKTPLFIKIGMQWESDTSEVFKTFKSCAIAPGSPQNTQITCNVSLPEAQLYYSKVRFYVGTLVPENCTILTFSPYFYRRSSNAAYMPTGQTDPKDCAVADRYDPICFGGAAPEMVSDFPTNNSRYFLPAVKNTEYFTLPAENTRRKYGGDNVNYLVTNNRTPGAPDPGGADPAAMAGNWVNYSVSCTTSWGRDLYKINLVISDENEEDNDPAGVDDFQDWD